MRAIRRAGLRVLGILDYGHPNYSRAGWRGVPCAGRSHAARSALAIRSTTRPMTRGRFARFASDVARRYRSSVIGWEIWNEENGGWRFWEPKEDPARLRAAAVHRPQGTEDVSTPVCRWRSVACSSLPLGGLVGTGGAKFLAQVLEVGGPAVRRCFDAVALSPVPVPVHLARGAGRRSWLGHRRGRSAAGGPAPLRSWAHALVEHRGRLADELPRQRRDRAPTGALRRRGLSCCPGRAACRY